MRLLITLMVVFLQIQFLLLASNSSTLDMQEHVEIKEPGALPEHGGLHIAAISKKGGGGGGGGGGGRGGGIIGGGGRRTGGGGRGTGGGGRGTGGSGRGIGGSGRGGNRGRRSGGSGGMLPVYGGAGGNPDSHQNHHRGAACRTAQLVLALPSMLLCLCIYLIQ